MSVTETRLITIIEAADLADLERFIARHRVPPRADVVMADLAGPGDEASR